MSIPDEGYSFYKGLSRHGINRNAFDITESSRVLGTILTLKSNPLEILMGLLLF